jgi:hypothetical protein
VTFIGFLDATTETQAAKDKNKLHFIKTENICASKDTVKMWKDNSPSGNHLETIQKRTYF